MEAKSSRLTYIQTLFFVAALVLVGKAMHLQLLDPSFRKEADAVAIENYTKYPSRGMIYDRNGKLLVHNNPMYDLLVTYNQIDPDMDTTLFCRLLRIDRDYFIKALQKDWRSGRFSKSVPFVFLSKISAATFARFQEYLYRFPGFEIQLRNAREYPLPVAAHLLGYIREVNKNEVDGQPELYTPGDYIGANGLEYSYENELRGQKGFSIVLKDNLGRIVGPYRQGHQDSKAESGLDLLTSIDLPLQEYGEQLMRNKRGGIVAIDPKTGGILAFISTPTYDPNELTITNNTRGDSYGKLVQDPHKPLFNRAIMAQYPPGSLFKPILSLIAMQMGVLSPDRTIRCGGAYFSGGQRLTGCHGHPTCTSVSMAIQHSCNAYFVTVFRDVVDKYGFYKPQPGLDTLHAYLQKFGLGQKLGVDFPGEKSGNFPASSFFDKWYKEDKWNSVWIRSLGIGQGEALATNIQLANAAAAIANRGWYITPHFVAGYRNSNRKVDPKYTQKHLTGIDPVYFGPVVDGMAGAVNAGTARRASIPEIQVCGKTGTAENPHGEDHSIFFCFAPKENPRIAMAVYIENAGFGGTYATPIAGLMIEKFLKGEIRSDERKYLEKRMLEANLLHLK
ncbi:MAG: penicillin-binding protein 2 [Haliscomenobacter sp.]|nr:penicillin-binding protein 2 [Haliscomenobacter sp.]MBK7475078.1 penicillin-binding protein 2 [Haliscomenobacter sp.]MBK8879885.1 penicillin-binding protein 2 [Haliscomenobacter sp.]